MQVTPAIYAIRHPFQVPVTPGRAIDRFVYSFFIVGETITLIDTGVAGCETRIFENIRSIGRDPREISLIILTHSHPDHIGAARAIWENTGCTIAAHAAERTWIEDVKRQNRERPVPGFDTLVGGPVQLEFELDGGDTIDTDGTGEYEIQVIHTPGHSAGSVSLFMQGEGALFSGDTIPVSGDLPVYDNYGQSVRSIQRLRSVQGIRHLLSSWDEPRRGDEVYGQMDQALWYLSTIHKAVLASAGDGNLEINEVTKRTVAALGLPPHAAGPLLARTFVANLKARDTDLREGFG
ncbi:MAG: MBL fold metallo-hydrolase [Methanoregula sp.]